tara:strand:+ start:290 stop:658 length:369 start_codon:yes stop_codon:yes gene_type:complete
MNDEDRVARREEVHQWQRHYNMEPRSDSRLTELYADGVVALPPDQVARELLAVDFLYRATLYGSLIEDFLREVAERLRRKHRLTWKATWDIVRFYGPMALKLMCLSSSYLTIPDRMPDLLKG